jgi:sugar O-acyltransferase (sialic acid O-acetyltransferase NeuD family)
MNYIIACAGGFGREMFHALSVSLQQQNQLTKKNNTIIGFIDDNLHALDNFGNYYPPIIDTIETYQPKTDEVIYVASGSPQGRRKISNLLRTRGCLFSSIIHPEARLLSQKVSIGNGSHIGWSVGVSCNVTIGQFVSLNCNLTIGHDVVIDDYVEVGPGTSISGFCRIEEGVHIAPNCTITPGVRVGAWSKISANTAVMRDVPPYSYVIGVPGTVHKDFFQHPDKQ